jgi:translocation-and-assembly-module (TAM) inner membrane subunit TamB-like protein
MSALDKPSKAERILRHFHLWSRRAATLVLILFVLLVAGVVYVWTTKSDIIAARGAAFLNAHVFGEGTHVVVGRIRGMPFHRLILEDVRLEGEGPEGKMAFLSAHELEVSYDLWGILHGRYVASSAAARGLHVEFLQREGGLYLPTFRSHKKRARTTTFRIENIAVVDGTARVEMPWRTVTIDSLNGGLTVESGSDGLRLTANRLVGRMNDALGTIELDKGTLGIRSPIRFDDLEGRWSGSRFALSGDIGKATDIKIQLEEFPLARLGKFLNRTDLDPGYVTRIQGNLKSNSGQVTFEALGDLSWEEWVLEGAQARGTIQQGMLDLRDVNAKIEGATLSRGTVRLPLHEAWFTVNVAAENLNTATLRLPVVDKMPGVVNGAADLRFGDRKNFLRALDMHVRLNQGTILQVPFQSGNVSAVVRDGTFRFDSLYVTLDGARATGGGKAGESFLDLEINYAGNLVPLRALARQPDMSGQADLHARLNGPPRSPILVGQGEVRQFSVSTVRAPLLVIEDAHGPVNENQNLHIRAVMPQGLRIATLPFNRGVITLAAAMDSARVDSVYIANADTVVTGFGSVRWKPDIRVSVNEANAVAAGHRFHAQSPFTIYRRGDIISTPGMLIDTPRGFASVAGEWNVTSRNGRLHAELHDIDPSVFFAKPPPLLIGKLNGLLELGGTGSAMTGRADLSMREVEWKRAHFDSVRVSAELDGQDLRVDQFLVRRGTGEVEIHGSIGLPEPIVPLFQKLRQHQYPDADATRWHLGMAARGVDLADWKFLVPPSQAMSGRVNLTGTMAGTSAHPELAVQGTALRLNWKGFEADSVGAEAAYAGGAIRVQNLVIGEGGQSATLRGSFPLDLAIFPYAASVPERPMDLRVEALDGSLHGLEFTPWIKKASGSLQAEVRAAGTPRHPQLDGWARVNNGRVELRERDEVVEHITARFAFKRDVVEVEEAKGIVTVNWAGNQLAGGEVTVEPGGTYRLGTREEQSYRLKIHANQALVGESGIYAARVSGNLELTPQRAYDGRIYPTARGDLTVQRMEYGGSLKPQDVGQSKPPSLLYEVNIDAPNKVFVRTEQAEAELGGTLTARQTPDRQIITGSLDVLDGSYRFLQKNFRVTQGTLSWNNPSSRIPNVDIEAETKEAGYLITVNLTGPADQVEVQFSAEALDSGPDQRALSESEIVSLLALGSVGLANMQNPNLSTQSNGTGTTGGSHALEAGAGFGLVGIDALLGGQVEQTLRRELGLNATFETENAQVYNEEKKQWEYMPKAGLSTYWGDLRFQYLQGLSRTYEQDVAVEYRLRRAVVLRGSIINLPQKSTQEYNLELKLHHDY